MAERRKTPNILADLLGDKEQDQALALQETANPQAILPAKLQNSKTASSHDPNPVAAAQNESDEETGEGSEANLTGKLKVTFYLSEASADRLEEAQRQLRRMGRGAVKAQSKAATSKSALLEEALKMACADLENKGKESHLARNLF